MERWENEERGRGERGIVEGKRDRRESGGREGDGVREVQGERVGWGWGWGEGERERERNFSSKIPTNELMRICAKSLCHIC